MPDIDLIVPTIPGREEDLARLAESADYYLGDYRWIEIHDQPTCGLGWIEGIKRSTAPYLILCCDDIEITSPPDGAIEAIDAGYIPAPVIWRPNRSIESAGGDMGQPGCLISTVQPDWTPVDFTPLPFVSREQIQKIGMISAHYMTDVYLSHKGKQFGYETVLRTNFRLIHHHSNVGRRHPGPDDQRIYNEAMRDE